MIDAQIGKPASIKTSICLIKFYKSDHDRFGQPAPFDLGGYAATKSLCLVAFLQKYALSDFG